MPTRSTWRPSTSTHSPAAGYESVRTRDARYRVLIAGELSPRARRALASAARGHPGPGDDRGRVGGHARIALVHPQTDPLPRRTPEVQPPPRAPRREDTVTD